MRCTWSTPPCPMLAKNGPHCAAHAKLSAQIASSQRLAKARLDAARRPSRAEVRAEREHAASLKDGAN